MSGLPTHAGKYVYVPAEGERTPTAGVPPRGCWVEAAELERWTRADHEIFMADRADREVTRAG